MVDYTSYLTKYIVDKNKNNKMDNIMYTWFVIYNRTKCDLTE